jgi:hypothetical protein
MARSRRTFIRTAAAASVGAAWGGATFFSSSGEAAPHLPARAPYAAQYNDLFQLPYCHSLFNAGLATIKTVFPGNPNEPADNVYEGHGVEAHIIITGVAGTKSQSPATTGYGIPAVSIVQDIYEYKDGDHMDCLVQSTIVFPFSAGTTESHAITQCNQPPDLTSSIGGYIIDQLFRGAMIAAVNAMGQEWQKTPFNAFLILDEIFLLYDKAIRNSVGNDINDALKSINPPIPLAITTGDIMAPFLVFSIPMFDKVKRTVDIQFNYVGFSAMLKTVDPHSNQIILGTALSLSASGTGHLSPAGLELNLSYKFNVGAGLLPLADKYAAAINGALIPKLEEYLKMLFPSKLDGILFALGGLPLAGPGLRPLSAPQKLGPTTTLSTGSYRISPEQISPKRRAAALTPK